MVLCGPHRAGCYGLAAARHLSAQGVNTVAFAPPAECDNNREARQELALYRLTGGKVAAKPKGAQWNRLQICYLEKKILCIYDASVSTLC